MEKNKFRKSEVIAFLEGQILSGAATDEQEELYIDYKWNGVLKRNNYTYKKLIKEMKRHYEGE
ncbi:hypothetical protein [Bacillus sp. T33-2]|uniref:hypothetical protein n=1 Tax=Bacillus sp. T33-2 TaxID=2054168 RepID=UPI000C784EDB|nr:hypothetical protein [Bacillus sp. T33-2]PLR99631.1 hypothetical protein CVD19_00790 [Bacillus sp. T33-2]